MGWNTWHLSWGNWHVGHLVHLWHLVASHLSSSVLVLLVWSSSTLVVSSSHVSLTLIHSHVHGLILLDESKKLLNDLSKMWLGGKVVPLESSGLLGLILLEIGLVLDLLNLLVSDLLDLIMVDDENLTVISLVMEGRFGGGSSVWLLEADECIRVSGLAFLKSDLLDLSVLLEEIGKVILSPGSWEVLNVEIASLLGGLVSNGVSGLLHLSLGLLQGMSDVKLDLVALGVLTDNSVVELGNGVLAALWSVLLVDTLLVIEADESILRVLDLLIFVDDERFDGSEWGKHFSNLVLRVIGWDVLEVEVVV